VALGAVLAARLISMRSTVKVISVGIAMGLAVILIVFIPSLPETHLFEQSFDVFGAPIIFSLSLRMSVALFMLLFIGVLAGFFVVPMNALLQHRGHVLMGAGHSIAVQNFNENLSILVMTGVYSALIAVNMPINGVIVLFGVSVAGTMYAVKRLHEANQRQHDDLALLDDVVH
jgi:MFS transporter, LPLT family, lysophospholipid transporter